MKVRFQIPFEEFKGELIAPGTFDEYIGVTVPLKVFGAQVGTAVIDKVTDDGVICTAIVASPQLAREILAEGDTTEQDQSDAQKWRQLMRDVENGLGGSVTQ